jgi:hypothetical protein
MDSCWWIKILLSEGDFHGENKRFPEASYICNSRQSYSAPDSRVRCGIFKKLGQFHFEDHAKATKPCLEAASERTQRNKFDVAIKPSFEASGRRVSMQCWQKR